MERQTTAVLLVNVGSRRGAECFDSALAGFASHGVKLKTALRSSSVPKLLDAARQAVEDGESLIAVGGGDGTLSALAEPLLGSSSTLAVIPLGTGNSLARDLGIPIDIAEACKIAVTGQPVKISVGRMAGKIFMNVATVGLSSRIAQHLTAPMKRRFGRLVYAVAVVKAYNEIQPFQAILRTENGTEEFDSLQVVIGNGRFHAGPFPVLPDASILERKLSVYAIETRTKAELLKFALFLPGGHHERLKEVHTQHCKGGFLTTSPPVRITVDGEVRIHTPAEFGVDPLGLSVMVDAESFQKLNEGTPEA